MIQAAPHYPWLRELVIPAFFTLFGAAIGFITSQIRDYWKVKRAKESFVRAIGMELDALSDQLDASFQEVKASTERVAGGTGPHFAATFRTSVYTSQIGKLRDVDDPLMIKVIHFYSDLGTLQHVFESVNDPGDEYHRTQVPSGQKDSVRPRLLSGLRVLQEQIGGFGKRLRELRATLPPAEQPK